ncbi:hypothetical protein KAX02_12305 [candidate division WOR-3 bacterium]|nr:hypothetical protein [candidate division WOR-3 bacterium]
MNYSNEIIKEYVKRFNEESKDNVEYNKGLRDMEKIDLENIIVEEVERVVKPFLYKWGRMGRVLGRQEFEHWKSKLKEQIQSNYKTLNDFKTKDLSNVDLSKFKTDIKKCYKSFKEIIGRTASTKVLHLICPNFFPPWDSKIVIATKSECYRKSKVSNKITEWSYEDYYRFMQQIQVFIKKYKNLVSELANQYGKSKLKIVDECLWWATQRPLCMFF